MNSNSTFNQFRNRIIERRRGLKDYAKSMQYFDNLLNEDEKSKQETLMPFKQIESNINNNSFTQEDVYAQHQQSTSDGDEPESKPEKKTFTQKLGLDKLREFISSIFETIKNAIWPSSKRSDNDCLKEALNSVDAAATKTTQLQVDKNSIDRVFFDLKLFGGIIHALIFLTILFVLFLVYQAIYRKCDLSDSSVSQWPAIVRQCRLNDKITSFMKFSLIFVNIITFIIVCYDKNQAMKDGYRVSEYLIVFCIFAGGVPTCWFLLFTLDHKTLKFNFMLLAVFATVASSFWLYLYRILDHH